MNTVFTDTWGGGSFELSVNFTFVGQFTPQQGQSGETFKGFQQFTSAVSSELGFGHVRGQERPKESNSCSRTLLRTHPGPRVLCWLAAGSSWVEFGFNLQMTEIAILELILPVLEWKAAPVHKKDFHPRLPGSWQPEITVSSRVQRTRDPRGGSALLHPE